MDWYLMVLKNYAGFEGRSRRKEYWMFTLISFLVSVVLILVGQAIEFEFLDSIYSFAIIIPSIAVGVRRLHDTNNSGWFLLVPIYNLVLLCTNGNAGENKYGPDPKGENTFNNDALDAI
jgi:uncharacterized membrane protein YhaH (DUF805 family)